MATAEATVRPWGGSISKDDVAVRAHFPSRAGNQFEIFYNHTTGLLVVDLVHKNERSGNELVRMVVDDSLALVHATKKRMKK